MGLLKRIAVVSLASFGFIAFGVIKYLGPVWVEKLYQQQRFDLLNFFTRSQGIQASGFYLGQITQDILGPASLVVAGVVLILLALRFLKDANKKIYGLAILGFLVATKWEVLFFPVYGGDAITGPFAEATWLAHHHFDYWTLAHQLGYTQGGPKVYLFSIYPTFLAAQIALFHSPKFFIFLNHFLVFAMSATIIALSREIMRKIFHPSIALLASLVLLSFPLFQAQTEMINMEMPCLFFAFFSVYFILSRRLLIAGICAVAATLVKVPGIFACAAVFFVCSGWFFFSRKNRLEWRYLGIGFATLLAGAGIVFISSRVITQGQSVGFMKIFSGAIVGHWIFVYFVVATLLICGRWLWDYLVLRKQNIAAWQQQNEKYGYVLVMGLYAGLWFFLFMNYSQIVPRYKLAVYPFLFFVVLFAFCLYVRKVFLQKIVLVSVSAVLLFATYGVWGDRSNGYHYIELERSLEYRPVLLRDLRLAREVEKKFSGFTIAAPSVIAQILAFPELGYVRTPFSVVTYGISCNLDGVRTFNGLRELDLGRTLWIGYEDDFTQEVSQLFPFPVDPNDKIVGEVVYGKEKAMLFFGGFAIEKMRILVSQNNSRRHYGMPPGR